MRRLLLLGRIDGPQWARVAVVWLLGLSASAFGQDDAKTVTLRGDDHAESGELDRAIADYTEAIRIDPRYAAAYTHRGSAWVKKHEFRKAIDDYSAAIALEPGKPSTYLLRGSAWSRQGRHGPAMADFDAAIRLAPGDAGAYIARAHEWERDLKRDRALVDFQQAIALDPRSIPAFEGRGRVWRKSGDYAKVVANFAELARVVPDHPLGHRELAWILATCDQDTIRDGRLALREASAACELTKWTDPACLEALAAACAELGDFDAAAGWQARALELFNANRDRADRRIISQKTRDAEMNYRLSRYKKRLPYRERPDQAAR